MTQTLFIIALSCFTTIYLYWGFTRLTEEKLQIFASVPHEKKDAGFWTGINFTWYGLLSANGVALSAALFIVLASAMGVPAYYALFLLLTLLSVLLPSARWIARIVEKKQHTFTIGGSVFAGILLSPILLLILNVCLPWITGFSYPLVQTLAALSIAYTFGESLGRLSCISFGCCYGKPLSDAHPFVRNLFQNHNFIFTGHTRKACYASHLDGVKTIPIQAVTSVIYALSALVGLVLLFSGLPLWALLETLIITQLWRSLSEFFRGDFRGNGFLSAYQIMGFAAVLLAVLTAGFLPEPTNLKADIGLGLRELWNPMIILLLQTLWFITFVYMGRSTITFSHLSFHVNESHI